MRPNYVTAEKPSIWQCAINEKQRFSPSADSCGRVGKNRTLQDPTSLFGPAEHLAESRLVRNAFECFDPLCSRFTM